MLPAGVNAQAGDKFTSKHFDDELSRAFAGRTRMTTFGYQSPSTAAEHQPKNSQRGAGQQVTADQDSSRARTKIKIKIKQSMITSATTHAP